MAKDLQHQINEFLEVWDLEQQEKFIRDVVPLFEMYFNVDKDFGLYDKEDGLEHATVRLIRSVYLISKMAECHAGKLATVKMQWPSLWKKMEKLNYDNLE